MSKERLTGGYQAAKEKKGYQPKPNSNNTSGTGGTGAGYQPPNQPTNQGGGNPPKKP